MKIKEQIRKLAAGCSKHRFEVVDRTDEVLDDEAGPQKISEKLCEDSLFGDQKVFCLVNLPIIRKSGKNSDAWVPLFELLMHNTVITLLSGGAIRSTHMTGTATDLGIEISRALYYSKQHHPRLPHVRVNKPKMWLLSGLMLSFLLGGVVGAWGYHLVGHHFALPVSAVLFILGAGSVGYDVKVRLKWAFVNWYRRKKEKRKKS